MKTRLFARSLYAAPLFAALAASAQSDEDSANRFCLTYRAGFNIKAHFKNLGAPGVPGGASVSGFSYEDGFVRPNSEPNDLDLSWNWGYQNASQVVGDNIVLTRSAPGNLGSSDADAPANGFELTYNRVLGHWGKSRWGLEAAFNYTALSVNDGSSPAGSVLRADAFSLGGSVPPAAPYAGSPDGPGVLISDLATPTTLNVRSKLDTSIVGLRLGPYWEMPLGDYVAVSLSAGFALAWVDSELSFREVVTIGGASGVMRSGRHSESDWLPGWYVGGNVSVKVYRSVSFFAGVQFQDVGNQVIRARDKQAKLDLSQSVFVSAGLTISF